MSKIICPVAKCNQSIPINSKDLGFKHFQDQDEFHKQLHWNWINYYFNDVVQTSYSNEVKFRIAYKKWNKQKQELMKSHKGKPEEPTNLEMKDEKILYEGHSYTPEEFSDLQKGKILPVNFKK